LNTDLLNNLNTNITEVNLELIWDFLGDSGNDFFVGGDASERISGQGGNDLLSGGRGNDWIYGDTGDDTLLGDSGDDFLSGGSGSDWLIGGPTTGYYRGDRDVLEGGAGADRLEGRAGADRLEGGQGADVLVGGSGPDRFIYDFDAITRSYGYYPPYSGGIKDTITDFQVSREEHDSIDLSQLFNSNLSTFTGTTVQQAISGGYVKLVQHGTSGQAGFGTTVIVDLNGNASDTGYYASDLTLIEVANVSANHVQESMIV
jgi:Ca2+-binding RTX toxin-like protein